MGHPVTTNPFIIMMINMTVVFIVLIALSFLIQLIHKLDPTKKPDVKESAPHAEEDEMQRLIRNVKDSKTVTSADIPSEDDIPEEVIAVIMASIAQCGINGEVRAVRIADRDNTAWKSKARSNLGVSK